MDKERTARVGKEGERNGERVREEGTSRRWVKHGSMESQKKSMGEIEGIKRRRNRERQLGRNWRSKVEEEAKEILKND